MSAWTPAREALLEELWPTGLSCSKIAAQLNALPGPRLSRNAVIGKAHRRKLCARHRSCAERGVPLNESAQLTVKLARLARDKAAGEGRFAPPATPLPPPEPARAHTAPLRALAAHACRWPLDDPGRGGMAEALFCGAPAATGASYCACHLKRAYLPPERQPKGGRAALLKQMLGLAAA